MNMKPNWITMADGCMKDRMGTFGFLTSTNPHGDPITMEDGLGTFSAGGHGALMSLGDGVFLITADGTGEADWDGIGSQPGVGDRAGCTGITVSIISAGVR